MTDDKFADLPEQRARGLRKMEQVYGFDMTDGEGDFFAYTADHLFADIWNRPGLTDRDRRLLLIGATAFGIASVLAAFSNSAEMLIATRALLGVAGAIAVHGYDGFLYSIGFLVAWLIPLLLILGGVFLLGFTEAVVLAIPLVAIGGLARPLGVVLGQHRGESGPGPGGRDDVRSPEPGTARGR